jgi:hypothetical protein
MNDRLFTHTNISLAPLQMVQPNTLTHYRSYAAGRAKGSLCYDPTLDLPVCGFTLTVFSILYSVIFVLKPNQIRVRRLGE